MSAMMEVFGVLIAFTLIIFLRLRNVDFTLSILIGGLIVALTSQMHPQFVLEAALETINDPMTWNILSAVALITILSHMLKETNTMIELIEGLRSILPTRVLLSIIPAMFGILAMPGGALMSAPFNEPEAERLKLKPERKTFINVWFRHIWYWASPLSPVTILTASIACYSVNEFVIAQLPLFPISLIIGFIFTNLFLKSNENNSKNQINYIKILSGLTPILLSVFLSIAGIPLWFSLLTGIIVLIAIKSVNINRVPSMALRGIKWDTVLSAFAILYFRYIVTGSGSVESLFDYITGFDIPLIVIFIVVPILVGAISGTPTMATGIVLPLFLPFCSGSINLVSLVYNGFIAGYMASPMHLCLVLTNSYYKSELGKVYKYLLPAVFIMYIVSLVYNLTMNGGLPL